MLSKKWIVYTFDIALFLFIAILLFSKVVSFSLSHDEHQFIAPSELLVSRGLMPYIDYPYLHMPYMVFINAIPVMLPFPHFFSVRIFNAIFLLLSAIIVYCESIRIIEVQPVFSKRILATGIVLVYMLNPVMNSSSGWALNHTAPMIFSLMALSWFLDAKKSSQPIQPWGIATGILIGISAFTRLTYALLIPIFLLFFFALPALSVRNRFYATASFLLGILVSALPAIYLIVKAPYEFFYGNFVYIRLNTIYQAYLDFNNIASFSAKITYFFSTIFLSPAGMLLFIGLGITLILGVRYLFKPKEIHNFHILFTAICSVAMFTTAFAPTPVWTKYFLAPLPFMALCLAYTLDEIFKKRQAIFLIYIISALLVLTIASPLYKTITGFSILNNPANWTPILVNNLAEQVKQQVKFGKVLTLGPLLALDTDVDVFEAFTVGPFSWRTSLLLSAEYRKRYGVLSPNELTNYLENSPPAAILTGIEADFAGFEENEYGGLENPFIQYAQTHHYRPITLFTSPKIAKNKLILWVP